jgi:hypothetical protein
VRKLGLSAVFAGLGLGSLALLLLILGITTSVRTTDTKPRWSAPVDEIVTLNHVRYDIQVVDPSAVIRHRTTGTGKHRSTSVDITLGPRLVELQPRSIVVTAPDGSLLEPDVSSFRDPQLDGSTVYVTEFYLHPKVKGQYHVRLATEQPVTVRLKADSEGAAWMAVGGVASGLVGVLLLVVGGVIVVIARSRRGTMPPAGPAWPPTGQPWPPAPPTGQAWPPAGQPWPPAPPGPPSA